MTHNTSENHNMLQFTQEQLFNMSEAVMLRFVCDFYQLNHPAEKSHDAVAYELGITTQALSNYLSGKGHVGHEGLITLLRFTGCRLIKDWMEAMWTK